MSKKPKSFIAEKQVEGTTVERKLERADARRQARELIANMPPKGAARQSYIRNLVARALKKEVSQEAFEEFVNLTNVQEEVEAVLARARHFADRTRI